MIFDTIKRLSEVIYRYFSGRAIKRGHMNECLWQSTPGIHNNLLINKSRKTPVHLSFPQESQAIVKYNS